MRHVIGCDVHKRYSIFVAISARGQRSKPVRVEHDRDAFRAFLQSLPPHCEIAVEATGHWYWIIDEMEQAEHRPHLANPHESKKLMGKPNKHDALDAGGLGILLHNGTLPEAWIPPGELRDVRELCHWHHKMADWNHKVAADGGRACSAAVHLSHKTTLMSSGIERSSPKIGQCRASGRNKRLRTRNDPKGLRPVGLEANVP
jgi:transposase